jgi:hypothetical protein
MEKITLEIEVTPEIVNAIANKAVAIMKTNEENKQQKQAEPNNKIYTLKEATSICGYKNVRTLSKHIRAGLLKAKKQGKSYLITHKNLMAYVNTK